MPGFCFVRIKSNRRPAGDLTPVLLPDVIPPKLPACPLAKAFQLLALSSSENELVWNEKNPDFCALAINIRHDIFTEKVVFFQLLVELIKS